MSSACHAARQNNSQKSQTVLQHSCTAPHLATLPWLVGVALHAGGAIHRALQEDGGRQVGEGGCVRARARVRVCVWWGWPGVHVGKRLGVMFIIGKLQWAMQEQRVGCGDANLQARTVVMC